MQYQGDIAPSQSLYFNFTSFSSSGTMSSLSGSANALGVYKDNNATFSISGVALTKDFNGIVGLNNVKIDTSTDSIFYAGGHDFGVVILSGTVLGQSWRGEVVGEFSINNRANLRPMVNGQNGINVSTTGSVSLTSPQVVNFISNITGTITGNLIGNVQGTVGNVTGSVNANIVQISGSAVNAALPQLGVNMLQIDGVNNATHASGNVPADIRNISGSTSGIITANVTQIDGFNNSIHAQGSYPGDLRDIIGALLSESQAGTIRSGFQKFFNVSGSISTVDHLNLVDTVTNPVTAGNVTGSVLGNVNGSVGSLLNQGVVTVSGSLSSPQNFNLIGNISGTVSEVLIVDKTINLVSGTSSGLDAAGVRSAVGLASANLDTQLSGISSNTDVKTSSRMPSGTVVVAQNNDKSGYSLSNPQSFNLIGNVSGTVSEVKLVDVTVNLVSGTSGGAGSDPWLTALPGAYGPGTAGNIVGNDLDAKISSRQPSGTFGSAPTVQQIDTQLSTVHGPGAWGFAGIINVASIAGNNVPPPVGSEVFAIRGDTFLWNIAGLDLSNILHMQFAVKMRLTDDDTESLLYVDSNGGLIYVNGSSAQIPANGSISYITASGTATIRIEALEMAKLGLVTDAQYDVQIIRSTGTNVQTPMQGDFNIIGDSTRATS